MGQIHRILLRRSFSETAIHTMRGILERPIAAVWTFSGLAMVVQSPPRQ
tara:strand:- start:8102 stop:8248 length:147 start_codon:yes stop_codon:yes gene_type:complete